MATYLVLRKTNQDWRSVGTAEGTADAAGARGALVEVVKANVSPPYQGRYGVCRVDNGLTVTLNNDPTLTDEIAGLDNG